MRSANWRGMALPILCLAVAACAKRDARPNAADPNTPAVVTAPPPVLPGDTVRKVVPPVTSLQIAAMTLARAYALLGGAFAFVDPKLIVASYEPTAELTTPNGTFTGHAAIVKEFQSFGMDGSVREFSRRSLARKIVDSTVVDSGIYTVVRARSRAASTTEHGAYASVWRVHAPPADWVMTRDHLYPVTKTGK